MITFEPLNEKIVTEFYGGRQSQTYRGYAATLNGKIVGIGGVYYEHGIPIAFSSMRPEMESDKKSIAKGIRILMRLIDSLGCDVYSFASPKYSSSKKLLDKLGFKPTGKTSEHGKILKYKNGSTHKSK